MVHYDNLNISQLRIGDIATLLPDDPRYGSFRNMLVKNIHVIEYSMINPITWVTFLRPYAYLNQDGTVYSGLEEFEAAADHKGLFYKVSRDVQIYENQIIEYHNGLWRAIGFEPIDPDGKVNLQMIEDGKLSDVFIKVPEMELNWNRISDWYDPNLKFYDPKDRKIKQYREYQPDRKSE